MLRESLNRTHDLIAPLADAMSLNMDVPEDGIDQANRVTRELSDARRLATELRRAVGDTRLPPLMEPEHDPMVRVQRVVHGLRITTKKTAEALSELTTSDESTIRKASSNVARLLGLIDEYYDLFVIEITSTTTCSVDDVDVVVDDVTTLFGSEVDANGIKKVVDATPENEFADPVVATLIKSIVATTRLAIANTVATKTKTKINAVARAAVVAKQQLRKRTSSMALVKVTTPSTKKPRTTTTRKRRDPDAVNNMTRSRGKMFENISTKPVEIFEMPEYPNLRFEVFSLSSWCKLSSTANGGKDYRSFNGSRAALKEWTIEQCMFCCGALTDASVNGLCVKLMCGCLVHRGCLYPVMQNNLRCLTGRLAVQRREMVIAFERRHSLKNVRPYAPTMNEMPLRDDTAPHSWLALPCHRQFANPVPTSLTRVSQYDLDHAIRIMDIRLIGRGRTPPRPMLEVRGTCFFCMHSLHEIVNEDVPGHVLIGQCRGSHVFHEACALNLAFVGGTCPMCVLNIPNATDAKYFRFEMASEERSRSFSGMMITDGVC